MKEKELAGAKRPPTANELVLSPEEQKSLALLSLFVVTLIMSAGLFWFLQEEDPELKQADLRIDYVFTKLLATHNLTYDLDLRMLMTNTAESKASNVRVEIAGIDDEAQLTYDMVESELFDIPARNTTEVSVKLTVPKVTAHRMFVMVFEEDELKLKGYSIISVTGDNSKRDFRVTYQRQNIQVEEPESEDNSDTVEILLFLFILLAIVELTAVIASLRTRHLRTAVTKLTWRVRKR